MIGPIITVENVTKNYTTGTTITQVIRGINISISQGEFVIIFGPSGSGKSTLLNIINGLEIPTSGKITVDGLDISKLNPQQKAEFHRQKIGMVFQAYNLIPSLTVLQNITLPLIFAKINKTERTRLAMTMLKDFDLEKLAHRLPTEISGGQMQRVGIMRALIGKPPIIVADEPTGNLDSVASKTVMGLFTDLNQKYQNTLVVVTHDPNLFVYADRIIHILDGQVVRETIRQRHASTEVKKVVFDTVFKNETNPEKQRLLTILTIMLTRQQLVSFDRYEIDKTIDLMSQRLANQIDTDRFYHQLDLSQTHGGAGLYQPTAKYIAESFDNLLKVIK